jgi:hypothetical protein
MPTVATTFTVFKLEGWSLLLAIAPFIKEILESAKLVPKFDALSSPPNNAIRRCPAARMGLCFDLEKAMEATD